jgi:hypothetical protein
MDVSFYFSDCFCCALACFNFFILALEKMFEILLLGLLCRLFDKVLAIAMVRGTLAMCLQMPMD